ncbi:hypothetical protein KIPB_013500, partial [Kipferlia bialata]
SRIDDLVQINEFLMKESDLFWSFLNKYEAPEKGSLANVPKPTADELTLEQKFYITLRGVEDIKEDVTGVQNRGRELKATLAALTKAAELKLAQLKKESYELKRDVLLTTDSDKDGIPVIKV